MLRFTSGDKFLSLSLSVFFFSITMKSSKVGGAFINAILK